jgi:hypothetical protein
MSKYFTKYLPVEGEIKKGVLTNKGTVLKSMFIPNKEILWITDTILDGKCVDSEDDCFQPHYLTPIKLFICSRDIQVGDKVQTKNPDNGEEVYCIINTEEELEEWIEDKAFKVIGEVSPEATWVKEGMEFEEDNVQILGEDNFGYKYLLEILNPKDVQKVIVQIKCSNCKNFH